MFYRSHVLLFLDFWMHFFFQAFIFLCYKTLLVDSYNYLCHVMSAFKGTIHPKMKTQLLSRVKFRSLQNISGALQQDSAAAFY